MKHSRGRVIEVTTLADLDARLAAGVGSLSGWRMIGLDLRERGPDLLRCSLEQALFLGCTFADGEDEVASASGAIVLPLIPGVPVDPYRSTLYTPRELYDCADYAESTDARAYAWSLCPPDADDALARALHDHSIDSALATWVTGRSVIGVMGGHALDRDSPVYAEVARLSRSLGHRFTVATGGGPGAMEAANLGALLADHPAEALDEALTALRRVPSFRPDIGRWARAALEVVESTSPGRETLGVPTWHYGHEPPNPFATSIAKFFANAPREAVLLEVCNAGIVFLPGAAGTVQEIFQDACENYYADPTSVAPMVLVDRHHWTEELPVWPLLQALARDRAMESCVHLVDTVEEAMDAVGRSEGRVSG